MRRKLHAAVILWVFLLSPAVAFGAAGLVRSVSGDLVTIESTGDTLPSVGDKAEIFFEIAGTGTEVSVASGRVQQVAPGQIVVKIDDATGTIEANQRARFISDPSHSPPETPPPSPPPTTVASPPAKLSPPPKSSSPISKKSQTPAPKAARPPPPPSTDADDGSAGPNDRFAAIAYSSKTGKWGWGSNYPTKAAAIARALKECGRRDAETFWCRNAWGALALSDKKPGVYGWSWGATEAAARSDAIRQCRKYSPDAHVVVCVSAYGN
jgi:hypothetical protein